MIKAIIVMMVISMMPMMALLMLMMMTIMMMMTTRVEKASHADLLQAAHLPLAQPTCCIARGQLKCHSSSIFGSSSLKSILFFRCFVWEFLCDKVPLKCIFLQSKVHNAQLRSKAHITSIIQKCNSGAGRRFPPPKDSNINILLRRGRIWNLWGQRRSADKFISVTLDWTVPQ